MSDMLSAKDNAALISAFKTFQKLADENYGKAYFPLSLFYSSSSQQYFAKAFDWCFNNQANQDEELWCDLGEMYEWGRGVEQDAAQAMNWFRKAAEQGNARGQINLGYMYEKGRGVEKNDVQAVYWYRKAAEQGNIEAQEALNKLGVGADREADMNSLNEGAIVKGVVKHISDFGAFVDLGGIDGLLHITDLAWRRVKHPSEVLTVGEVVEAKILRIDQEKNRVSLGIKQMSDEPWIGLAHRYPQGIRIFGKVTCLTDYGSFVEIEQGIEGLVHISNMNLTNKNDHPSNVVSLGDEVEVMILEVDEARRRISLGMKQCQADPWDDFAINHKKGDKVKGAIKSITDFGVFIGLDGGIVGLVHLSDLSWSQPGEEAVRSYKKGDEVEAVVLAIDVERERISLGIKQLSR